MLTTLLSKLLKQILIAASLFFGLKADFGLNLERSNSFSSFSIDHSGCNILPKASSSILSLGLSIVIFVEINFKPLDKSKFQT